MSGTTSGTKSGTYSGSRTKLNLFDTIIDMPGGKLAYSEKNPKVVATC